MSRLVRIVVLGVLLLLGTACTRAGENAHTGQLTLSDGRVFECRLVLPASWTNKYEPRTLDNIVWFDYSVNQAMKHPIFAITALTDEEWALAQGEPGLGTLLREVDGAVFIYNIALENLHSGAQATEFQRMAGEVQSIVATLQVTAVP